MIAELEARERIAVTDTDDRAALGSHLEELAIDLSGLILTMRADMRDRILDPEAYIAHLELSRNRAMLLAYGCWAGR